MSVRSYMLSARTEAVQGRDPSAVRPGDLYRQLESMDGVCIVNAAMPDLWNIRATDDAIRTLQSLAQGWQVFPAPGPVTDDLPAMFAEAPEWLGNPPVWAAPSVEPSASLPESLHYIFSAGEGAVHPRLVRELLRDIEGVRVIDDASPYEWLIEATYEGYESLRKEQTGWSLRLQMSSPRPPSAPRPF